MRINFFKKHFVKILIFSFIVNSPASGFYNLGAAVKGALAPFFVGGGVANYQPGFTFTGTSVVGFGTADGMFVNPKAVVTDSAGNIYVADGGNGRINKYNSSGVFQGWIGKIGASPAGGAAGCKGALSYTPGWCTGGSSVYGSSDGELNWPSALALDSADNIYVVDRGNYRIVKYNSSGVYQGWTGGIEMSPTGGAAGCSGATGYTPGWCTGGTAKYGGLTQQDGVFRSPEGIAVDSSGNIYVSDTIGYRVLKFNSLGVYQGWIGGIQISPTGGDAGCIGATGYTPGWCTGGSAMKSCGVGCTTPTGYTDGHLPNPEGITVDLTGNIYIVVVNKVVKYNSSGVFQGWIGAINTTYPPTGGAAGCVGAVGYTPGWCTGGRAGSGAGDGQLNSPQAAFVDSSGNIYVADSSNFRIVKYNSSGVYQGWVGGITTSPTGGAAGCNGATGFTPGWCTGGSASGGTGDRFRYPVHLNIDSAGNIYLVDGGRIVKYNSSIVALGAIQSLVSFETDGWESSSAAEWGQGDSLFDVPQGVATDSAGNFYVADSSNNRIVKYNSSGLYQGWVGGITTSPTSGTAGCNGATGFTPGWCIGGTSTSGNGDGLLDWPYSVAVDQSGNFYVTAGYGRIVKYNSAGVYQGWIGKIATSPTGGAAGCNGATGYTPGWCTGGTGGSDSSDGHLSYWVQGLAIDAAGNLFVSDSGNHRVIKYDSAGVYQGWIGAIGTPPTGGAAGCNGATGVTPGWCTGGLATDGTGDGMLSYPQGIVLDASGNIYVADGNHRVVKYNSSGVYQGWIGGISGSPTGGAAGCNGATGYTPGWCTGGTSTDWLVGDNQDGAFYMDSLAIDYHGNLYVGDDNGRIIKYNSAGVYQGWIGAIDKSPDGGDTGCKASVGYTPGWCRGGSSAYGQDGAPGFNEPYGVTIDSRGNLYVSDTYNNRIVRLSTQGR